MEDSTLLKKFGKISPKLCSNLFSLRDCRQITFVMLNRFCLSSKTPHTPVLNGQYQDGWNTNQNRMKNTPLFTLYFKFFEGTSSKNL